MPSPIDALNAKIFINCPFDPEFFEILRAIVFAVKACGFQPLTAQDEGDSGHTEPVNDSETAGAID